MTDPFASPLETNRAAVPAGWYADGVTPGVLRWWSGNSWTEHTQSAAANPAAGYAPAGYPAAAGYAAATYPAAAGYPGAVAAPTRQPALGTSPYTPFIWIIALLPVLSLVAFLLWDPSTFVDAIAAQSAARATVGGRLGANAAIYGDLGPGYAVIVAFGWVSYGATVVLAYFDFRRLGRLGFGRRFHWAWSFLSPIVYLIGRSVVVRSQVGRGLGVLWVYVLIGVLSVVIVSARLVMAFVAAAPLMTR